MKSWSWTKVNTEVDKIASIKSILDLNMLLYCSYALFETESAIQFKCAVIVTGRSKVHWRAETPLISILRAWTVKGEFIYN